MGITSTLSYHIVKNFPFSILRAFKIENAPSNLVNFSLVSADQKFAHVAPFTPKLKHV